MVKRAPRHSAQRHFCDTRKDISDVIILRVDTLSVVLVNVYMLSDIILKVDNTQNDDTNDIQHDGILSN